MVGPDPVDEEVVFEIFDPICVFNRRVDRIDRYAGDLVMVKDVLLACSFASVEV